MVDVFDAKLTPERLFLDDLAQDLAGTFSLIAYAGMSDDVEFIREMQRQIKEQYSPYIPEIRSDVAFDHIFPAYETLQEILTYGTTPQERQRIAEECLNEHLTVGEDPEHEEIFQEYVDNSS